MGSRYFLTVILVLLNIYYSLADKIEGEKLEEIRSKSDGPTVIFILLLFILIPLGMFFEKQKTRKVRDSR